MFLSWHLPPFWLLPLDLSFLLPAGLADTPYHDKHRALQSWSEGHHESPPPFPASTHQKEWDTPIIQAVYDLLALATNSRSRAHILAAHKSQSGAWLHAFPLSSIGLRMDNQTIRIALVLRLGCPLCHPHICHLCGAEVDFLGLHGLSCQKSQGCYSRHAVLNKLLKRLLMSMGIPARLGLSGYANQTENDQMAPHSFHGAEDEC